MWKSDTSTVIFFLQKVQVVTAVTEKYQITAVAEKYYHLILHIC